MARLRKYYAVSFAQPFPVHFGNVYLGPELVKSGSHYPAGAVLAYHPVDPAIKAWLDWCVEHHAKDGRTMIVKEVER